jgi:3D (Asp-Asp-Asp) domain-containing protein
MRIAIGGGAALAGMLFATSVFIFAKPLNAGVPTQEPTKQTNQTPISTPTAPSQPPAAEVKPEADTDNEEAAPIENAITVEHAERNGIIYSATAYALPGRTASGLRVGKGILAADPRVLPLGTRVMLSAGSYSGEYVVADTGTAIKGKRLDIWMPSYREACRWGRRNIKLTVISYPERRRGRNLVTAKPIPVAPRPAAPAPKPIPVTEAKAVVPIVN